MPLTRAEAEARLSPYGQEHVLAFWDTLNAEQQQVLSRQLEQLDLAWLERANAGELAPAIPDAITPYTEVIGLADPRTMEAYQLGEEALRAGRVATLLVAGGQGTRLGFDGPKGAYPIGPLSGRTLFQMHAERQRALGRRYGIVPPLYVMTSPENHEATVALFEQHERFGLPRDRVSLFSQGLNPAVDEAGRLLLASPHELVRAPNGNGGLFAALRESGGLAALRDQGVDAVSYVQVDNPLSLSCDPRFVGFHLLGASAFSCKAIAKLHPAEKVGHYARVRGRLAIVEYGELPDALAHARDGEGRLCYGFANPGLFIWSRAFLEAQAERSDLPVHRAKKKIRHIDAAGRVVVPEAPNGYKLELFALDTLPDAATSLVLECSRADEFAPVKNRDGDDSPSSARAMIAALHRRWIEAAGASVATGCRVEISPLFALDEAEVARRVPAGHRFAHDTFLERQALLRAPSAIK